RPHTARVGAQPFAAGGGSGGSFVGRTRGAEGFGAAGCSCNGKLLASDGRRTPQAPGECRGRQREGPGRPAGRGCAEAAGRRPAGARRPAAAEAGRVDGAREKPLRQTNEPLMAQQGKAALLLVDDDPDLLRLLAIRLKANGYGVTP